MILSDAGIKAAIEAGTIEIDPAPVAYSPSAVDLLLGNEFQSWDDERLSVPGVITTVDLAEQRFPLTAAAYLKGCSPRAGRIRDLPAIQGTAITYVGHYP
jgi:hypothetical protein